MIPPSTVTIEFSQPERLQFSILNKKTEFDKQDLEKMEKILLNTLPASQNTEKGYWKGSNLLEKTFYYFDYFNFGKNAKVHEIKVQNEQLLKKIQAAIQILKDRENSQNG